MMSDKLIGPKVKIVLAKFLPAIFMDAMRDNAEASVHMFEGKLYKAKFSAGRRNCTSPVWLSIWNWSHHGKIFQSGKLYVKHDKDCFIRYLDSVVWYIKHDSSDYQTLRSNISNMRTSVSFDFQTPISYISNTRMSVSSDMQTLRSNIWNTKRSVSSDIQTQEIIHTREGVIHLISKHRDVIHQTREGVFHLISKHWEVIYQQTGVSNITYTI